MAVVKTSLGNTKESARRERFEPVGAITQTNVQKAIEQAASTPPAVVATPITFASSPYTMLATDTFIEVDTAGGAVVINAMAAAGRNGVPVTVKDVTGHANANNVTINPAVGETFDGLAAWTINVDFGAVRLVPKTGVGYRQDA